MGCPLNGVHCIQQGMNVQRGGREGEGDGETETEIGKEVGSYPSHCSHVQPHLIGQFVMSLQEEDGRTHRSVKD